MTADHARDIIIITHNPKANCIGLAHYTQVYTSGPDSRTNLFTTLLCITLLLL